jgi:cytochrome c
LGVFRGARTRRAQKLSALAAAALVVLTPQGSARASQPQKDQTIWDGVYSASQAVRGETAYQRECAYCHRPDLRGGFFDNGDGRAPALAGPQAFDSSFTERWSGQAVAQLVATLVATMPQPRPSSLSVQTYVDIAAFLLQKNGAPAGPEELRPDADRLSAIQITPKP